MKKPKTSWYTWGKRTLTIAEWAGEPDIWLRGIDEGVLRARLEPRVGTAWAVNRALTTPTLSGDAEFAWRLLLDPNPPRGFKRFATRMRKALLERVEEHGLTLLIQPF